MVSFCIGGWEGLAVQFSPKETLQHSTHQNLNSDHCLWGTDQSLTSDPMNASSNAQNCNYSNWVVGSEIPPLNTTPRTTLGIVDFIQDNTDFLFWTSEWSTPAPLEKLACLPRSSWLRFPPHLQDHLGSPGWLSPDALHKASGPSCLPKTRWVCLKRPPKLRSVLAAQNALQEGSG
jgi:hypothetical protein